MDLLKTIELRFGGTIERAESHVRVEGFNESKSVVLAKSVISGHL